MFVNYFNIENSFFVISAIVNIITSFVFILFTFHKNKTKVGRSFIWFALFVGLWSTAYFFWQIANSYNQALLWVRILTFFTIFIPISYYNFIIKFLNIKKKFYKNLLYLSFIIAIVFIFIIPTKFLIVGLFPEKIFDYWPRAGIGYNFLLFFFSFYVIYSWWLLINFYRKVNKKIKKQIIFVLIGTLIGFLGGATNFFLWYNIPILPFGNILVSIYIAFIGYAIIKYNFLNVKFFFIHFLIIILNIITFVYIFFSVSFRDYLIKSFFFLSLAFISYFLKKSFDKEIQQKEKLERLFKKLEESNKKLKEIDHNKTEFVSLASHQLRTPATAIKGFISLANEGAYGEINENIKKVLKNIEMSADRLLDLTEDLLNISRIEMGKLKFTIKEHNICDIINELKESFKIKADQKNLKIFFSCSEELKNKKIGLDKEKIREVISNLIDNAIKYTERGKVRVKAFVKDDDAARIEISDTGVGIDPKDLPIIFDKFTRGIGSSQYNTSGLGIGIYLAKNIVEFHKGKIWAVSKGRDKGSTFIVELPLKSELLAQIRKEIVKKEVENFLKSI